MGKYAQSKLHNGNSRRMPPAPVARRTVKQTTQREVTKLECEGGTQICSGELVRRYNVNGSEAKS
jgi:hypothetical protein